MAAVQTAVEGVLTHWSLLLLTTFSIVTPVTAAGAVAEDGGVTKMPAAPELLNVRPFTVTPFAFTVSPFAAAPWMMVLAALPLIAASDSMVRPVSASGTVFDVPVGSADAM